LGDIFKSKPYHSYEPNAPQQFRNSPPGEPAVLMNGTTIVEIGFVDFGITFDSIESLNEDNREGPLIVI